MRNLFKKYLKNSFVFFLVTLWLYSGWPKFFNFPLSPDIVSAAQDLRPDGDSTQDGDWEDEFGTLILWDSIEEVVPSDSDYVWHDRGVNGDYFEITLDDPSGEPDSGDHIIYWRAARIVGGKSVTVRCSLLQGSTVIASDGEEALSSSSYSTFSYTLEDLEVAEITDYNDLRLRFTVTGTSGAGSPPAPSVSWAYFSIPDVASLHDVSAPTSVSMPDYQLGGVGYVDRNFNDVSAAIQVTAVSGFSLSVQSSSLTGSNNTILASDIRLRTDGMVGTDPTIISSCAGYSGITETSNGEYGLDTVQTIMTTTSGTGTCDIFPTIRVYIDDDVYAELDSGTLTFTVS